MAASEVFRRALLQGLAVLGEPSLLDGQPAGNIEVQRSVRLFAGIMDQANDNHVVGADTVLIDAQYDPQVGQVVEHPSEGRYQLTRLLEDDGVSRRFIAVRLP